MLKILDKFKSLSLPRKVVIGGLLITVLLAFLFLFFSRDSSAPTLESLKAFDRDRNGVWDDLDPYILEKSTTENEKKALTFFIHQYQRLLLNPDLALDVRNETGREDVFGRGRECFVRVYGEENPRLKAFEVRDKILNSRARMTAWIHYSQKLSGAILHGWDEKTQGNPCPF